MYKKLLNKINSFDNITIFRHIRPDGDSMFSALALFEFLKDNFKNKKVKVCGYDKFDLVTKNDNVSDKFIMNSLAIVLDTSNTNRIDDFRALASKYIVKIDHHPPLEQYGDMNIVDPKCSSACELLSKILFSSSFKNFKMSRKACEYLYSGILTDTINFKTTNTTADTLMIASKLVEKGNLQPSDIVEKLFNKDIKSYKKITKIRNYLKVDGNFGFIKLNDNELKKIGFNSDAAKNNIDEIGCINEFNVWAFAVEKDKHWDCSIRSKKGYIINKIALKYNGGGHPNASAVKHLNASELKNLFNDLKILANK